MKRPFDVIAGLTICFGMVAFQWFDWADSSVASQARPNVVLIVADDMGYGDLGVYGAQDISTPHLDALASEGIRFTSFYANGPQCTPTRTALLTGRYQQRAGGLECAIGVGNVGRYDDAICLANRNQLGLPADESVLPSALKSAGYNTGMVGKWHLGYESKFRPSAHGFDHFVGVLGGEVDYFHHVEVYRTESGKERADHMLFRNGHRQVRDGYYMTDLITDESVAWINQQREDTPFFLYLPYTAPHAPFQRRDDYRKNRLTRDEWGDGTREDYSEMVEAMDEGIGRVLRKLEADGFADNTVVIFFSDNGPNAKGSSGAFRGKKGDLFEGGIRVPGIIRWPGRLASGLVTDQTAMSMDLAVSILRIVGASAPPDRPMDGLDIVRHLEEGREDITRTLFWRYKRGGDLKKAVRHGQMKYVYDVDDNKSAKEYLFDLESDPAEQDNLLSKYPAEFADLKERLRVWEEDVTPTRSRSDGGACF